MTQCVYSIHPVGQPAKRFYIGRTGHAKKREAAHRSPKGGKVYEKICELKASGIESEMTILSRHKSAAMAYLAERSLLQVEKGLLNSRRATQAVHEPEWRLITWMPRNLMKRLDAIRHKRQLPSRSATVRALILEALEKA